MGFGALAVDMGYLQYQQMRMQTAADNAAVAGAQTLIAGGCPNQAAANTAGQSNAATNGFGQSAQVDVTVDNPPKATDGPYHGVNCAVSVTVSVPKPATWFLNFLGFGGMPITTQAVAQLEQNNPGCIFLLTPGVSSNFSGSSEVLPSCDVLINGTANMNNAEVDAAAIGYAGTAPSESGSNFPVARPTPMLPVADPCPEIAGCASLKANAPSISGCSAGGTYSNATLSPGCYTNLTLTGNDTLEPGLYVINGTFNVGNAATVTGSGVTLYMTAAVSSPIFGSGSLVTLSAPSSGSSQGVPGVVLYRDPAQMAAVDFSPCKCNLSGLIYLPTTPVTYASGASSYAVMVFGSVNFLNTSPIDFFGPASGASLIDNVVLVQ